MPEKKHFVYFMNTRDRDGNIRKYPVYRSGDVFYIGDHKVPEGKDIEDEIKKVYDVEVIGPEMPHPLHEESKFKSQ